MKVIGLLCWYEESPSWLAAAVASCKGFVDHFVAVDGAYALYPGAFQQPASGPEQVETIIQTAKACGIACSVHVPAEPWEGNETGKRTFLFRAGELVAEPWEDWYFVLDGDDLLENVPFDARERLEGANEDVAEVTLRWREDWEANAKRRAMAEEMAGAASDEWSVPHRALFRAIPGLRCGGRHMIYEYEDVDGEIRYLRGEPADVRELEPALDLLDLRVEHRHTWRNPARRKAAADYYALRDELGVEAA